MPVLRNARRRRRRPARAIGRQRGAGERAPWPASASRSADSSSASAAWPLPETPAIADDLAGAHGERHVVEQRAAHAPATSHAPPARRRRRPRLRRATGRATAWPTISSASCVAVGLAARQRRRRACPARSTAMRSRHAQHLVELVADEDDRQALGRPAARASRTAPRSPAASAPPSARRGSGCARRGTAPSGSRRAGARRPRGSPTARVGIDRAGRTLRGRESRARAPPAPRAGRHSGSVPSITLSSTHRLSASVKCWCTMPMPAASAAVRLARRRAAGRRPRSCRRRRRSGRTGSTPASTCRRRSRRAAPAPRRPEVERDRVVGDQRAEALGDAGEQAQGALGSAEPQRRPGRSAPRLTSRGCALGGRLRLVVVDLHRELAVEDVGFSFALTLATGRPAPSSRTCRAAPAPSPCASSSSTGRSPRP